MLKTNKDQDTAQNHTDRTFRHFADARDGEPRDASGSPADKTAYFESKVK
jgi:hypothetical protein